MARPHTGPKYFPSRGGYYVNIDGHRYCLAKGPRNDSETKRKAEEAYHRLKLAALVDSSMATIERLCALLALYGAELRAELDKYKPGGGRKPDPGVRRTDD